MKTSLLVRLSLLIGLSSCASRAPVETNPDPKSVYAVSAREFRAVLDVPVLGALLNEAPIQKIERVSGSKDTFEVDSGYCKAKIRVIAAASATANPRAESLGAECGP